MLNMFKKNQPPAVAAQTGTQHGPGSFAVRPEDLTLRIKHISFLEALRAHGVPDDQMPVTEALCGELLVAYAFDLPDQFVMATPPMLADAGLPTQGLSAIAQANLKGKFSAQLLKTDQDGLMTLRAGGDMEAVLLVFDGFWDQHVRGHVQGEICVAAPRRDVLLIADSAVPGALQALTEQAADMRNATTDNHGLSVQIMQRTNAAWRLRNTP